MNRKTLIGLFKIGMRWPKGRHRLWICRCIEIIVGERGAVELNEYEDYGEEKGESSKHHLNGNRGHHSMFLLGRNRLLVRKGKVIEES